jgi:hypothetical protein
MAFIRSREVLVELAGVFLQDSPDVVYEFAMICEYYRLENGSHSEAFNDITQFYHLMTDALMAGQCPSLPEHDPRLGYHNQSLLVPTRRLG